MNYDTQFDQFLNYREAVAQAVCPNHKSDWTENEEVTPSTQNETPKEETTKEPEL